MAIAVALANNEIPNPLDITQQQLIVDLILTVSGNYPANGDTLSFAGLGIQSNQVPTQVEIYEATPAGVAQSGYAFRFSPGTTQANGVMQAWNGTTQFSAGAYGTPPFSVTGFALRARAWFPIFV